MDDHETLECGREIDKWLGLLEPYVERARRSRDGAASIACRESSHYVECESAATVDDFNAQGAVRFAFRAEVGGSPVLVSALFGTRRGLVTHLDHTLANTPPCVFRE